jgi:leucyl-tRNA synthetase
LISRQRYWGAPIPIIYCEKCGEIPVPESDLPVILPEEVSIKLTGESPLRYDKDFYNTTCPKCGGKATRETDTMDTFVCSSWYYLRYTDPKNDTEFAAKDKLKYWLPVDMYIGGAEHTVLHLLYSRFFTKALRDAGYLDFDEPFIKLRHQGMILGPDGLKMSKSKGNVIDPSAEVDKYGADALRMYLAFMGPFDQGGPWNPNGLVGARRFLDKFYDFVSRVNPEKGDWHNGVMVSADENEVRLARITNKLIQKVSVDLSEMKFNTCISAFMEALNSYVELEKDLPIEKHNSKWREALGQTLLVMAPFAPHLTEELFEKLGFEGSIHVQQWPTFDKKLLTDELVTVAVQVNGKLRDQVLVVPGVKEAEVLKLAKESEKISAYLTGKKITKSFYVQDKILSIVTD